MTKSEVAHCLSSTIAGMVGATSAETVREVVEEFAVNPLFWEAMAVVNARAADIAAAAERGYGLYERKSSIQIATGSSKHKFASDIVHVMHPDDHAAILRVLGFSGPPETPPPPPAQADASVPPIGALVR